MDESERNRLLATHGDRASAERTLRTITRRSLPAEDVAACIADNLLTSPEAWHWWLAQGSREDITAQAGQVACPVLVLGGSDDPVIPPSVIADDVMPRLADASRIEIAGAGHLLPLEAAQEVGARSGPSSRNGAVAQVRKQTAHETGSAGRSTPFDGGQPPPRAFSADRNQRMIPEEGQYTCVGRAHPPDRFAEGRLMGPAWRPEMAAPWFMFATGIENSYPTIKNGSAASTRWRSAGTTRIGAGISNS